MSHAWKGGSTRRWRQVRALVLANNQATNAGRCTLTIQGVCTGQATQVHHVLGKANGDDPRYLTAVCGECNRHVGDPNRWNPPHKRISKW